MGTIAIALVNRSASLSEFTYPIPTGPYRPSARTAFMPLSAALSMIPCPYPLGHPSPRSPFSITNLSRMVGSMRYPSPIGRKSGITDSIPERFVPLRIFFGASSAFSESLSKLLSESIPFRAMLDIPPAQRQQCLFDWNRTERGFQEDKSLHELIELQAARTPDSPAVIYN